MHLPCIIYSRAVHLDIVLSQGIVQSSRQARIAEPHKMDISVQFVDSEIYFCAEAPFLSFLRGICSYLMLLVFLVANVVPFKVHETATACKVHLLIMR